MKNLILNPPLLGFIIGTRAALAFGVGLLVADRMAEKRRRSLAMSLISLGAASTIPAARMLLQHRAPASRRERVLSWARTAMRRWR